MGFVESPENDVVDAVGLSRTNFGDNFAIFLVNVDFRTVAHRLFVLLDLLLQSRCVWSPPRARCRRQPFLRDISVTGLQALYKTFLTVCE